MIMINKKTTMLSITFIACLSLNFNTKAFAENVENPHGDSPTDQLVVDNDSTTKTSDVVDNKDDTVVDDLNPTTKTSDVVDNKDDTVVDDLNPTKVNNNKKVITVHTSANKSAHNNGVGGKTSVKDIMPTTSKYIGKFNIAMYQMFINPFASAYRKFVPALADKKINDVIDWSYGPYYMVNDILRFDMRKLANNMGSFLINGTVGVLGIFDISSSFNIHQSKDVVLGTLHTWGLQDRYYMELPLIGPQTELTLVSLVAGTFMKPTNWIASSNIIDPGKTFYDNMVYTRNIISYTTTGVKISTGLNVLNSIPGDKEELMRDAWLSLNNLYLEGKSAYDLDLGDTEDDEFGGGDDEFSNDEETDF